MTQFRTILDVTAVEWLEAMALTKDEIPEVIIVEGSWWREQRLKWRLGYLDEVRELGVPDIFWGKWKGKKIGFCMAYGAPRTVEIIHLFGVLGTKLAIQLGTCGGLQTFEKPGDIILPEIAFARDGVAHHFGDVEAAAADLAWVDRADALLKARNHTTHRGAHMTYASLFTETAVMMEAWHKAGILSVDMETATTFATARFFNMSAISLLVVWDDLTRGKRFVDPLTDDEQKALERANQNVFEVALALAETL